MSKTALAMGMAGLLLAFCSTAAPAMPAAPISKTVISDLNSNIEQARWRRCWFDRWGRRHCHWCWRDRWGRVRCG